MIKKKSILAYLLAFCLIIPTMFMLSACGHKHTFSDDWSSDKSYHWHSATCEHKDEKIDYAEHTFGSWLVKTPAGVHQDRIEERKCSVCDYSEQRTIANTATHTYSGWLSNAEKHWKESTCKHNPTLIIEEGSHIYDDDNDADCNVCGYVRIIKSNDVIAEGGFEKGSQLSADKIESTDSSYKSIISKISDKDYNEEKVAVFDISLANSEGSKIQPNGKVKITMPKPFESENGYTTFHIKGDGSVETLETTVEGSNIVFETSSFSNFIVTANLSEEEKQTVTSLVLDAHNAGFTYDDEELAEKTVVEIGSEIRPNAEYVLVYGVTANGNKYLTKDTDYTIDLGGLNFERAGTYTITYTYKKDTSLKATIVVEVVAHKYVFEALVGNGNGYIYFNSTLQPNGYKTEVVEGAQITLNADADRNYIFVGWFTSDEQLISTSSEYTFTMGSEDTYVFAYFEEKITSLVLDAHNAGFTYDDEELAEKTIVEIGSEIRPNAENVLVYGVTVSGNKYLTKDTDYTIDLGGLNFERAGTYTITYTYKKDTYIKTTIVVEVVAHKYVFEALVGNGNGKIYFNSVEQPNGYKVEVVEGSQITLNAVADRNYIFAGWFTSDEQLISTSSEYTFTMGSEDTYVFARFEAKVTSLVLDAHNAGFTYDDETLAEKTVVEIGSEIRPNAEYVLVYGVTVSGNKYLTKDTDYTIDLGGLNFERAGTYTITYTYKKDTSLKATIVVEVVEQSPVTDPAITYSCSYSDSMEHPYNGAAVFVSKKDIYIDGVALRDITDEEILSKITYVWRDRNTKALVTPDLDITITGTQYAFGRDNELVGDEMAGPCVVGEYEFVLFYNGVEKIVADATITESSFSKIYSVDEFDATTAPTIFGEICYYTIVGFVNGKMYVMQMPASSTNLTELNIDAEARLITPESDGSIILGGKYDFVFTPMRYNQDEWRYYPEDSTAREDLLVDFCTGYYGARTGVIGLATPIIYRSGWTRLSGDRIVREEGSYVGINYGNLTKFAEDGAVTIYAPRKGETSNNALRLVKNADGSFVFTGKDSTTDTRESYPIYIYKQYVKSEQSGQYDFYNKLDKEYDGNAVEFNAYKDVYIETENGENIYDLIKMGTVRFVFTDLKDNVVMVGNIQDDGTVLGPSSVGQYKLIVQILEKGEKGEEWVEKAVLNEFEIHSTN